MYKYSGLCSYVDYAGDVYGDYVQIAKEALVFLINSVNESWKLPVGYFFTGGLTSDQKASLVKQCLTLLKNVGVNITSITFDGCPANIGMCKILGFNLNKKNMKPYFNYDG